MLIIAIHTLVLLREVFSAARDMLLLEKIIDIDKIISACDEKIVEIYKIITRVISACEGWLTFSTKKKNTAKPLLTDTSHRQTLSHSPSHI